MAKPDATAAISRKRRDPETSSGWQKKRDRHDHFVVSRRQI